MFFLVSGGRLPAPLLYLSAYLERDRQRYYGALQSVQEIGDVMPWIEMFLTAVETQASDGVSRPTAVRLLRQLEERGVLSEGRSGLRGQRRYVARELMATVAGEWEGRAGGRVA